MGSLLPDYDVIVVGAGHAGCEAAHAAATMGSKTLLITLDMNKIAQMSCNPAVGGIAKGQIVREIDALGGMMGLVTDQSTIQFRMLNRSKGPAMWSPRAQCDRMIFSAEWRRVLEGCPNLDLFQDNVISLLIESNSVCGVRTQLGLEFHAPRVILTNGTFLNGLMHVGRVSFSGGRIAEPSSSGLTEQLVSLGFTSKRMKTGTPVRLDGRSIDFSKLQVQDGDGDFHRFSFLNSGSHYPLKQRSCYIAYTNKSVHDVLVSGFEDSPLFNGTITSIGPRYCPSIETKLKMFPDRDSHHLFLEPEGKDTCEYYLNGFSSSLPWEIQLKGLRLIEGFEKAKIYRPGYAIEYDYFPPTQLDQTLQTRRIRGLYFAGQINGTTGYEEAACQGLMAGINAHLSLHSVEDFVLKRDEAYIGVLIDDLVTKGVDEPYRMFTSRAEYRVLLRQENADARLTEKGYGIGLVSSDRISVFRKKSLSVKFLLHFLDEISVKPEEANSYLLSVGTTPINQSNKIIALLGRPQVSLHSMIPFISSLRFFLIENNITDEVMESAEIAIKYSGYIDRENLIVNRQKKLEDLKIEGRFDYQKISSLSIEAREKLSKFQPKTLGQASRISGVSPADIAVLLVLLEG